MQAPPDKQNSTCPAPQKAEEAQQLVAQRLWNPAPASMCLLAQSGALVPAGFPIVRHRRHHLAQQLGALTAQTSIRFENQRSHGRSIAFRFLRLPCKCSRPWTPRTVFVTFCMRASHADIDPQLVQDTREPGDHIQYRTPHHWCFPFFVNMPITKHRDMSFEIRMAPCLLDESAWRASDCSLWSGSGPPYVQQNG